MVMRLELFFERPLSREQRHAALIACAGLAKCERVRLIQGDHCLLLMGEALSTQRVLEALAECDLRPQRCHNSLVEDDDAVADDDSSKATKERLRPIGR